MIQSIRYILIPVAQITNTLINNSTTRLLTQANKTPDGNHYILKTKLPLPACFQEYIAYTHQEICAELMKQSIQNPSWAETWLNGWWTT